MPLSKYDSKLAHWLARCPFCGIRGSTAGLAGHVAAQHNDADLPKWTEIAPDNWRLSPQDPHVPTAVVCAINDYKECPPWWWAIQTDDGIRASGTALTLAEAQDKAWTQWLRNTDFQTAN